MYKTHGVHQEFHAWLLSFSVFLAGVSSHVRCTYPIPLQAKHRMDGCYFRRGRGRGVGDGISNFLLFSGCMQPAMCVVLYGEPEGERDRERERQRESHL